MQTKAAFEQKQLCKC